MPWIMQMAGCALTILLVSFALYVGFWAFLVLASISITLVTWRHLRNYLVMKGILNPAPGVPPSGYTADEATQITIIDAEYTRLDDAKDEKIK